MNKSKASISQTKIKPKLPILSPTNNKSLSRNKQKYDRVSPRSTRIHTLQVKKTIQIPKKGKVALELDQALLQKTPKSNESAKGYQTPKFKCEVEAAERAKKGQVSHNFFSFGEKEFEKDPVVRKKTDKAKERERENISNRNKEAKDARPYRKDHLIR